MPATMLSSHAGDDATTQGCTGCGRVAQPRAESIEALSHCEGVEYLCWLIAE
jgi:hypothetical protein